MRIFFQGHRGTGANTNQSLRININLFVNPSAHVWYTFQELPVEDVRLRSECLWPLALLTYKDYFMLFLSFLTYWRYGNEKTSEM